VIEPAIDLLIPQIDDRGMKLERTFTGTVYPVQCDPDLIKIVFINLLGNGIRYGNKGGALRVSVEKGYKKFLVSVWNEGPGFSEQDKHLLLRNFPGCTAGNWRIEREAVWALRFMEDHTHARRKDIRGIGRLHLGPVHLRASQYMDLCIV